MKNKITDKQERFCQEYMIDLNATQAAIRAGYSEKTARSQGQRMLTFVDIQERVAELKAEMSELSTLTKEDLLEKLAKLTDADRDNDKIRATELYMKHLGMLDDRSKVEHSGNGFVIEIVSAKDVT